jgi:hypothetical protein
MIYISSSLARAGSSGGGLCRYFKDKGFINIKGADKEPLPHWYQRVPGVECLSLDLSEELNCRRAGEGANEVCHLAAGMGGTGFIERFRVECHAFIKLVLNWEPSTPLKVGLKKTYAWIKEHYMLRRAGQRVILD